MDTSEKNLAGTISGTSSVIGFVEKGRERGEDGAEAEAEALRRCGCAKHQLPLCKCVVCVPTGIVAYCTSEDQRALGLSWQCGGQQGGRKPGERGEKHSEMTIPERPSLSHC